MRINTDGALRDSTHVVQFYEQDSYLLDDVSEFIGRALHAEETGMWWRLPLTARRSTGGFRRAVLI
jgi:hypothetical protein